MITSVCVEAIDRSWAKFVQLMESDAIDYRTDPEHKFDQWLLEEHGAHLMNYSTVAFENEDDRLAFLMRFA